MCCSALSGRLTYENKIISHFSHELVLLKLSQPIYMDKKIRKICLPLMRYQFPQSLDEDHDDLLTNFISLRKLDRTVSSIGCNRFILLTISS